MTVTSLAGMTSVVLVIPGFATPKPVQPAKLSPPGAAVAVTATTVPAA